MLPMKTRKDENMEPHLAFKIATEDAEAAAHIVTSLVADVIAGSALPVRAAGSAKIMARRILLKALISLDPEYRDAAKSLLDSEFNLSDYEHQWLSYSNAADDLARIACEYHDREFEGSE
jgi:hypothetical protein